MPANKRTVTPATDGGWTVDGGPRGNFPTQAEAAAAARRSLETSGGGELAIKGRNGQVREQNTIKPAHDPRRSRG
jgi:hypothetical protein